MSKPLRGSQSWPCPNCNDTPTEQIYIEKGRHLCTSCGLPVSRPCRAFSDHETEDETREIDRQVSGRWEK